MYNKYMMREQIYLTYDNAIYWLNPFCYAEYRVDWHVMRDAAFDIQAYVQEQLRRTGATEMAKMHDGWLRYTTIADERNEGDMTIFRHTLYEQPGFTEIKLLRAPNEWVVFRRFDDTTHQVVELPLRRLMYRGERVRGALHDNVLYVVL